MKNKQLNTPYHLFGLPNDHMKVVSFRKFTKTKRSGVILAIVIFQIATWLLYLSIHIANYIQFQPAETFVHTSFLTKMGLALTHVFSQFYFIWFSLLSVFGIIGLMNVKSWGWAIALITNSLYISMIAMANAQGLHLGTRFEKYFFIYLILFAGFSSIYLWIKRAVFWR